MATRVQYRSFGGPDVLELVEFPTPTPGDGEVLVRVLAAGVNPIDAKLRARVRPSPVITEPRTLGADAAGIVEAVGSAVTGWEPGDEVVVHGVSAGYASHLIAAPERLLRKPATVGWAEAAGLGVAVSTAYQALRSLRVSTGELLIVHGGSGAVGRAAIQFAHSWGVRVIATAGEASHERLIELGAEPVLYGPGLRARLEALTGGSADAALDAVGTEEAINTSLALVADSARIGTIVVGSRAAELGIQAWAGGNPLPLTADEVLLRAEALPVALDLMGRGEFHIDVAKTLPLAQAAEAHRIIEGGHPGGKLILIP